MTNQQNAPSGQVLTPEWPAPNNVMAMTTLRHTILEDIPHLPARPCHLKQVHGAKAICADLLTVERPHADAAYAFQPRSVCIVQTADCLPVLLCDKAGTQVAAIHAGWRGLAAGIIQETCKQLTANPKDCMAWLGPAIGPEAFEVGQDVLDGFLTHGWNEAVLQQAFVARDVPGKWLGNLTALARQTLQDFGFSADNIYGGAWCTYSDPARFYSYRRSKEDGRMSSLIWLK